VHVQLGPWRDRDRVTHRPAPAWRPAWTGAAIVCAAALTACSPEPSTPPRLAIEWAAPPAAGVDSVADIRLLDASDRPLPRAALRVNAFMNHPGMAPVEAAVHEEGDGRYRARVRFTMAGDWVVRVQGATADGRTIDLHNDVRGVRPAP
jgi:hypothetical protein